MPITIGSNISSLRATNQLQRTTTAVSSSFERLSSGLRINKAGDDPAGLSVASALEVKKFVLQRGKLNAADAVSLLNIADSATAEITIVMTRMAELAEQAASGALSDEQRSSLNLEYRALDQEIRRITSSTEFNGQSVLMGDAANNAVQALTSATGSSITAVSPDGRYALETNSGDTTSFRLIDTATGMTTTVEADSLGYTGSVTNAHFTAAGSFVFDQYETGATGTEDLFMYDISSGETTKLTDSQVGANIFEFNISADGSTLAFDSNTFYAADGYLGDPAFIAPAGLAQQIVLDIATGAFRGSSIAGFPVSHFELSEDGSQVAYEDGAGDIYLFRPEPGVEFDLMNTDRSGYELIGITNSGIATLEHANGIYQTGASGSEQLLYDLTGYTGRGFEVNLDGTSIYFASTEDVVGENPGGVLQAYKFDTFTGELTQETAYTANPASSPSYTIEISTDGSSMFASTTDGGNETTAKLDIRRDANNYDFEVGSGAEGAIITEVGALLSEVSGLGAFTLSSQDSAIEALEKMNAAIDSLSAMRGKIGAGLTRLEIAETTAGAQAIEAGAARARIVDVDVATEVAKMTSNSIKQQAITAILAQANQQPQIALSLLSNG